MTSLAPLYEIESELIELLDSVDVCPAELLPELEERIARHMTAEAEKIDRISHVFSMLEAQQVAAKTEIARLRERQQSAERAVERLSGYILRILQMRDNKPLRSRLATFSVRHSEALIIVDPNAVPDEWKRVTVTTDILKDPIKKALKEGSSIPGVAIEIRRHLARK